MPRYRYTATALSGKTLHGVTEAASAEALYITLREQDLYMTDAKEVGTNASVYRPLKTPELAEFCRSLGTLLSAGVPLVRAFRIMADERGSRASCSSTGGAAAVSCCVPSVPTCQSARDAAYT